MPQIGAPSADSFPAARQGGASNGKEERPLHFSIDDGDRIGGNAYVLNFADLDWSTHRLTQKLCTVHDQLGDIGRLSKKAKSDCVSARQ
jgi:hypothetical protein